MVSPAGAAASLSSPVVPGVCSSPLNVTAVSVSGHCPLLAYDRYLDEPDVHVQTLNINTGVTNNVGNPATVVQVRNDGPETTSSGSPSFSPAGNWIAYSSDAPNPLGPGHIWLVRTNGTQNQQLTTGGGEGSPVFSADGKYVYYTAQGASASEGISLWRVNINSRQRQQITHFPKFFGIYGLDRGGNEFTFTPLLSITAPIYTMSLNGTHVTAVPNTAGGQVPHLNAAGNQLIFYTPYGTAGIKTVHTDGSHLRNLTPGQNYLQPDWSRDGTLIAFIDADQNLFVARSNGSGISEVGAFGAVQHPVWQP